tara:strand:+ start:1010 stop:1231 length:222 start_codon:yes stop_codon:yes gene_type:complete
MENKENSKINFSKIRTVGDMRLIIELLGFTAFIKGSTLEKFDHRKINLAYKRGILEVSNEEDDQLEALNEEKN